MNVKAEAIHTGTIWTMKPMKLVVVLMALFVAGAAHAQEPLNLEKAIGIAMEQNQALRGAGHDLDAAHWGKLNAFTNFLPRVELSSSVTRIDPESERRANAAIDFIKASAGMLGVPPSALADLRPFAYRDTYGTNLTVVQPVYNGGAELLGVRAANAMSDKSEYSFEDAQQDVVARVKISYYTALKAEELLTLAKEAFARTQRYLEMTRRRAEVGQRTRTDVQRWEVQQASSEGTLINAENFVAAARLQLNEVMGVDLRKEFVLEKIVPTDSSDAEIGQLVPTPHEASFPQGAAPSAPAGFVDAHPSMKIMEANLRLADIGIQRSWVNFQPRVNVAFQYGWEKNGTAKLDGHRPWALAFHVSYPIFNGFGDYAQSRKKRRPNAIGPKPRWTSSAGVC